MLVSGLKDLSIFKMVSGRDEKCPDLHRRLCECVEEMLLKYEQKKEPGKKLTIKTRAAEKLLTALYEVPKGQRETREAISSALKHHAQALQGHEHLLSEKGNTYALIEQTKGLRETHDNKSTSLLRYHELRNKFLGSDTPLDDEEKKIMSELDKKKDLTLKMLEAIDRDFPFISRNSKRKAMSDFIMASRKLNADLFKLYSCDKAFESFDISGTPGVLANVPENIRIDIRNAMKKAGYHHNEKGMCYGIAWVALLACVRKDGQTYMERIQYLKQMCIPPLRRADVYQVYPFFDALTLSQANYKLMDGYQEGIGYPGRQEVAFPGRIISSHRPGYEVVPVVKHTFITECVPQTFIQCLQYVRENNKGRPFGVMISYRYHAASIGFDGKKWLTADHDTHYYTESTVLLYTFLGRQSHRYKNGKMIARINVVADNEYSLNINYDAFVVNVKECQAISWVLYLALWDGYITIITDCVKEIDRRYDHTPGKLITSLHCKDNRGYPGFHMTLWNGHAESIIAFVREIAVAIAKIPQSKEQKAKWLYDLLVSKADNGESGFCKILQQRHSEAISAFIKAGAAAIATFSESEEERAELIYGLFHRMESEHKPAFLAALSYGGPAIKKAFNEGFDQLSLSDEKKEILKNPATSIPYIPYFDFGCGEY